MSTPAIVTPALPATPPTDNVQLRGPAQVVQANFLPIVLERNEVRLSISTVQDLDNKPMGYLVTDDVLSYAIVGIKASLAPGMATPGASVADSDPGDEHVPASKATKAKKAN